MSGRLVVVELVRVWLGLEADQEVQGGRDRDQRHEHHDTHQSHVCGVEWMRVLAAVRLEFRRLNSTARMTETAQPIKSAHHSHATPSQHTCLHRPFPPSLPPSLMLTLTLIMQHHSTMSLRLVAHRMLGTPLPVLRTASRSMGFFKSTWLSVSSLNARMRYSNSRGIVDMLKKCVACAEDDGEDKKAEGETPAQPEPTEQEKMIAQLNEQIATLTVCASSLAPPFVVCLHDPISFWFDCVVFMYVAHDLSQDKYKRSLAEAENYRRRADLEVRVESHELNVLQPINARSGCQREGVCHLQVRKGACVCG